MAIKLIVAVDANGAIGNKSKLLFHCPEDLKRFKELTTNHIVLMGRKTYESLPNGALPNRINTVLTRDNSFKPDNPKVIVEHDLDRVINYYCNTGNQEKDLWVIGGENIYKQLIPHVEEFHITLIHKEAEKADVYYPFEDMLNDKRVILSASEEVYSEAIDAKVSFLTYKRIKNEI